MNTAYFLGAAVEGSHRVNFAGGLTAGPYTPARDAGAVLALFGEWFAYSPHSGTILEVGAGDGDTTRLLAAEFPFLTVHALEFAQVSGTPIQQRKEVPAVPAARAAECGNVRILQANSLTVNFASLAPAAIFIDGNHTLAHCLADSLNAIAALARNECGGIVAWHDYRPGTEPHNWCAVVPAVSVAGRIHRLDVHHVPGTAVAFAIVPPSRRIPFPALAPAPAATGGPLPTTNSAAAAGGGAA